MAARVGPYAVFPEKLSTGPIVPMQSSPSTGPNINMFYPDEHYWPHPDDTLKHCSTTKVRRTQGMATGLGVH